VAVYDWVQELPVLSSFAYALKVIVLLEVETEIFAGIQVLSFTVYVFIVATLPAIELINFTL
jgi:hypothetical protein